MARPTDLDLSEFQAHLKRDRELALSTKATYPSAVRWIFRRFNGWPPSGDAVGAAIADSDLAVTTSNLYLSAWEKFLDFTQSQGHEVWHLRGVRKSLRDHSRTMGPEECRAIRRIVEKGYGLSIARLPSLSWRQIQFHRDYIRITGVGSQVATDPECAPDFFTLAKWGLGKTELPEERELIAYLSDLPLPVIPRVRGGVEPVSVVTLRNWLAKYA